MTATLLCSVTAAHYRSYSPRNASVDEVFDSGVTYHSAEGLLEGAEQQRLYQERLKELNAHVYPTRPPETEYGRKPRSASMVTAPARDQLKPKPWESPRSTGNLLQDADDVYYSLPSRGKVASDIPDGYAPQVSSPWYRPSRLSLPHMSPEHSVSTPNISSPVHTAAPDSRELYDLQENMAAAYNGYSEPQLLLTQTDIVGHAALGSLPNTLVPKAPWPSILKPGKKAGKRWQLSAGKPPPKPQRVSWTAPSSGRGADHGQPLLRHSSSGPIATYGPTPSDFVSRSDSGEILGHNRSSPQPVLEVEIHPAPVITLDVIEQEPGKTDVKSSYIEKPSIKERNCVVATKPQSIIIGGGGLRRQSDPADDGKMVPDRPRMNGGKQSPVTPETPSGGDPWQTTHRRKKRVSFSDSNLLVDLSVPDNSSIEHSLTNGHRIDEDLQVAQDIKRSSVDGLMTAPTPQSTGLAGKGHLGVQQGYNPVTWTALQPKITNGPEPNNKVLAKPSNSKQNQGSPQVYGHHTAAGADGLQGVGGLLGKQLPEPQVLTLPTEGIGKAPKLHADMSSKELKLLSKSFNNHLGDGTLHRSPVKETRTLDLIKETGTLINAEQYQFMNSLPSNKKPSYKVPSSEKPVVVAPLDTKPSNKPPPLEKSKCKPTDVTWDPFDDIPFIDSDEGLDTHRARPNSLPLNYRLNKENIQPKSASTKSRQKGKEPLAIRGQISQPKHSDNSLKNIHSKWQPVQNTLETCNVPNKSNISCRLDSMDFDQILLVQTDTFLIADDAKHSGTHPNKTDENQNFGPQTKGNKTYRLYDADQPQSRENNKINGFNQNINNSSNDKFNPDVSTPRGVMFIPEGADGGAGCPSDEELDMVDGMVAMEVHIDTHIRTEERGRLCLRPVDSEVSELEGYVESVVDHAYAAVQEEYDMEPDGRKETFVKTAIGHACAEICRDIELSDNADDKRVFRNAAAEELAQLRNNYKTNSKSLSSAGSPGKSKANSSTKYNYKSNGYAPVDNNSPRRKYNVGKERNEEQYGAEEIISASQETGLNSANPSEQKWTQLICEDGDHYVAMPEFSTPQYKPSFRGSPNTRGSYYSSYIEDPYASDALSDISEGDESASTASRGGAQGATGHNSSITWEDISDTEEPYAGHVDISDDEAIDEKFPDIVRTLPESTRVERPPAVNQRTKIDERPLQILTPLCNGNHFHNGGSLLNDSKDSGVISGTDTTSENDTVRTLSRLKASPSVSPAEIIADVHYVGVSHSVPPDVCAKTDSSLSHAVGNCSSPRSTDSDHLWSNQIKHISFRTKRANTNSDMIKSSHEDCLHTQPSSSQSSDLNPDLDNLDVGQASLTGQQVVKPVSSSSVNHGRKVHVVSRIDSFWEEMRRYKGMHEGEVAWLGSIYNTVNGRDHDHVIFISKKFIIYKYVANRFNLRTKTHHLTLSAATQNM